MSGKNSDLTVLQETLVRSLTGLSFGLLVAVCIVLMSWDGWRPIKQLKTWGSDIGLRVLAEPTFTLHGNLSTDTPFVFIDIDRQACRGFVVTHPNPAACDDAARPPLALLSAIISGLDTQNPKAIVLDYLVPLTDANAPSDEGAVYDQFKTLLTKSDGPPLIAPMRLSPNQSPARTQELAGVQLVDDRRKGRLRLASFMTWTDPKVGDGILRGYPTFVDVDRPDATLPLYVLPSVPFLTAVIAKSPGGMVDADALFFSDHRGINCDAVKTGLSKVVETAAPFLSKHCKHNSILDSSEFLKRQVFSIHSLAIPDAFLDDPEQRRQHRLDLESAYRGSGTVEGGMLYRHFTLSDFADETGKFERFFRDIDVQGQIIVVGTSDFGGNDWHRTSIGALSGAEVIINATRAFMDFSPLAEVNDLWAQLQSKIYLTFIAGVTMFAFIWGSVALKHGNLVSWMVLAPAVYLLGIGVSMAAVTGFTYFGLKQGYSFVSLDFLLPVLAVAFEGLVEISHGYILFVHERIEKWLGLKG